MVLGPALGLILSTACGAATSNTAAHTRPSNTAEAEQLTQPTNLCAEAAANKAFEPVQIQRVSDGDTVVLTDGRKVRIIGINAPELSKKSERALEGEARNAASAVKQLVADSNQVDLIVGDDAVDRYGRVLGHIVFDKKRSLAGELLARGLAAATSVSPNTKCATHNLRIERIAREQKRGVWQYDNNPWFGLSSKANAIQGFHILTSVVTDIAKTKKNWEIRLRNGVVVRARISLLTDKEALGLQEQTVEVRGWFGQHDGLTSVRLHHHTNLTVQP